MEWDTLVGYFVTRRGRQLKERVAGRQCGRGGVYCLLERSAVVGGLFAR